MKFATSYDSFDAMSRETALSMTDPATGEVDLGKTQQSFKDECDINEIVRRFGLTGELPENPKLPQYGDFTEVLDYRSALDAVIAAERDFMQLPGALRARFGHDPQQLLMFLDDPKNLDEARKLGLVNLPPEKTRTAVDALDELAGKLAPAEAKK